MTYRDVPGAQAVIKLFSCLHLDFGYNLYGVFPSENRITLHLHLIRHAPKAPQCHHSRMGKGEYKLSDHQNAPRVFLIIQIGAADSENGGRFDMRDRSFHLAAAR